MAEHTVSLIFAVAKQTVNVDGAVRDGQWPRAMVQQLHGKTLGVIGTGAIGREVARLGAGIGMNVIAWSFNQRGDHAWVPLEDLFRRSDVVSVHVRQSPETLGMIRAEHFAMMKPTAIFINTAHCRSRARRVRGRAAAVRLAATPPAERRADASCGGNHA